MDVDVGDSVGERPISSITKSSTTTELTTCEVRFFSRDMTIMLTYCIKKNA